MGATGADHEVRAERPASRSHDTPSTPQPAATEPVLQRLQRAAGNRAVAALVQRSLGTATPQDANVVRHEPQERRGRLEGREEEQVADLHAPARKGERRCPGQADGRRLGTCRARDGATAITRGVREDPERRDRGKTAQGKNAFPEIATRTVPMQNVVAVFDMERIHFGPTEPNANDGHIARLLSYRILDGARARYEGTASWPTIATLGQLEYKPQEAPPTAKDIRLSVNFKSRPGQDLFVVGSIPELGNWDPARAVPMTYQDGSTWSLVHTLQPGSSVSKGNRFEYKFIVKEKGSIRWEGDPNHDYDPAVRVGTSKPERWHE